MEDRNLAGQKLDTPKLVSAAKPKKKLATIVQMETPLDEFPNETQDDTASERSPAY